MTCEYQNAPVIAGFSCLFQKYKKGSIDKSKYI